MKLAAPLPEIDSSSWSVELLSVYFTSVDNRLNCGLCCWVTSNKSSASTSLLSNRSLFFTFIFESGWHNASALKTRERFNKVKSGQGKKSCLASNRPEEHYHQLLLSERWNRRVRIRCVLLRWVVRNDKSRTGMTNKNGVGKLELGEINDN